MTPAPGHSARERLDAARLYLVCDAIAPERLDAALAAGVDLVQLRMKDARDEDILAQAAALREVCDAHRALFLIDDRPDLAVRAGADGVHVGQADASPAQARAAVGPDRLVGLSTHSPAQIDAAAGDPDVDYTGVGPVHATPTKPGRAAVGLELVAYAASRAPGAPFFAIGGIDETTVGAIIAAGAQRVAVVRAITQAADPGAAARRLRDALERVAERAPVGAAQP